MIYFVTNNAHHLSYYRKNLFDNIEVLEDNLETYSTFLAYFTLHDVIGYDVESTGLDAWKNSTVLKIIGNTENQFVFHTGFCDFTKYYKWLFDTNKLLLGHNIKFDIKFGYTENNILYRNVYDTMIAEQRLYMKSGISNSLENLTIRYLDKYPDAMDKSIRLEFINVNPAKFVVEPRHIYYAANDVEVLFPIKKKQEETINKYKMERLLYDIEFPLISIIAKAEVTGFEFDKDKWLEIYNQNLLNKFKIECQLDIELRNLRDYYLGVNHPNRIYMVGGKWDNIRQKTDIDLIFNDNGSTNITDLFGDKMSSKTYTGLKKKIIKNPNNINYSSDTQIIEIFAILEEPLPTKQGSLVIPKFNKKQKIDKTFYSFMTGEPALNEYLSDLPNTPLKNFILLLIEHRGLSTACNNFGANFIDKLNPITGRLHTIFRQAAADTGRFQSGGGTQEPDKPNFQNIPSKADYAIKMRNCFIAKEGYSIGTHDLSGAELIIMCSLSQDMKLLEIALKDIHSYVAQGCWRLIYKNRAKQLIKKYQDKISKITTYKNQEEITEINKLIDLSKTYIVDKTVKAVRTAFKPMTFGTIYGMYAAKAGRTLNISKEEGQIVIDFIKAEFPDVFRMVENASNLARKNGYVIINNRTNSRAWFPNIIQLLKGNISEKDSFKYIAKEMSEARNIRIQGTQADMIKEATVELQKWIDTYNLSDKITILSWVHDEIVDEHPKWLDGVSEEWKENKNLNFTNLLYNNKWYDNFPAVKAQIMRDVCNKYLHNVTMDVEYEVKPYWTK